MDFENILSHHKIFFHQGTSNFNMTFVNLLKRKRDRVGLEPVFDFQWHPLKNETHLICDFVPSWDVQFGKIQKLTVTQQLQQAKKDFIGIGKVSWNSHRA